MRFVAILGCGGDFYGACRIWSHSRSRRIIKMKSLSISHAELSIDRPHYISLVLLFQDRYM